MSGIVAADDTPGEAGLSRTEPEASVQTDSQNVRPVTILVLLSLTLGLFVATGFITRSYHGLQDRFARQWYRRGEAALEAEQAQTAVKDFRTALSYSRDNPQYRLRLAQALLAAHRTDEALAHFRSLWQDEPGNGDINLQLARLAAQRNDVQDALRYFHVAMYGAWEQNADVHRREARFELIQFLLARNDRMQAQAELTAVAAGLPPANIPLRLKTAELFARTGDYSAALNQYRQVLSVERRNQQALAGAGRASFEVGQYQEAERYLDAAVRENRRDSDSDQLRQRAELVVGMNPYARGITDTERYRRAIVAFQQAGNRLQSCAQTQGQTLAALQQSNLPGSALSTLFGRWESLRRSMSERALRRDPDLLQSAMRLTFDIESETARECGEPSGSDLALLLISRQKEGGVQ